MLMDDTVFLATSRERLIEKLYILDEFCESHGMIINESKTKFMVIHGGVRDRMPIKISSRMIEHCDQYVYLGSIFTSDGSTKSSLCARQKHYNKLVLFLRNNCDMPFVMKKKVIDAAFNAALLYGCESWLDTNLKDVEKLYVGAIKNLLAVRVTTPSDLCLIELGYPPLRALVRRRQQQFFSRMMSDRRHMTDDTLMFAIDLTQTHSEKMRECINGTLIYANIVTGAHELNNKVSSAAGTKFRTYCNINRDLSVHNVYSTYIPEHLRIAFTRVRLSSHRLRIETGRWARIPRERRLCECGTVQDEEHVLVRCPLTEPLRRRYGKAVTFPDIIDSANCEDDFRFIHDVMSSYN